ncbi:hypothetical protein J1P26_20015 [Neobacillus sp. MM2021_6]|uniref:NUMOD4 domain-containing protein n=1 Tax=Bacillaceae TaxID=186817 RepID=UPI0014073056|nr:MULTISPECIES: NUMOD4 domain-containing protein [Bacillaceae]MBO0961995.1 hypothetical protein [Neobacillus sp. MM2021_6]NHC20309.1 hypothetical protein [Bacillus sp. MM2020_4]
MIYLYDPRTNILTETTYSYLSELTGMSKGNLMSYKSSKKRLGKISCYIVDENVTVQQRKAWYEKEKYHNETWKVIDGSDGIFLVSNHGRFQRVYKNHTGFLLPTLKKRGRFLEIKVRFKGIYKNYQVAKLVAHHFIEPPSSGEVLHHKNLIKTDNFAGNLEYISRGKLGGKTGHKSKCKPVIQLCRFTGEVLEEYRSAREAGRKSFVSYQSVMDCCNGKHKHSGGIYVFKWAEEYESDF